MFLFSHEEVESSRRGKSHPEQSEYTKKQIPAAEDIPTANENGKSPDADLVDDGKMALLEGLPITAN